jgi:Putative lactococcus lactis phage r1t holin
VLTRAFWLDAAERAVRTAAQTALGVITALGVSVGLLDVPWLLVASSSGLAALVSALMSVVGSQVGEPDTASLLPEVDGRHAA